MCSRKRHHHQCLAEPILRCTRPQFCRWLLALAMIFFATPYLGHCKEKESETATAQVSGPLEIVFPKDGAYLGAYVDFGEGESHVTYNGVKAFDKMIGKHLAVIAFGNFWGDQEFPRRTLDILSTYGAIPLVFWSPWDKPYDEERGPDRFNLNDILAGKWDAYIDQWADEARQYGKPLLVTWGLEMNGLWFPWAGYYYGAGKVVGQKDGRPLFMGPELFKKAYRYVVDRVRARKADNIKWGFHANHYGLPLENWNALSNYYPGADYVDWLGLSVYAKMHRSEDWSWFRNVMEDPYIELCQLDADKPVIVAEWGVGEFPPDDKAEYFRKAFADMKSRYPRVRAAVYWHEGWENKDESYTNMYVNSSAKALNAFKRAVKDPYWIGSPQYRLRHTGL